MLSRHRREPVRPTSALLHRLRCAIDAAPLRQVAGAGCRCGAHAQGCDRSGGRRAGAGGSAHHGLRRRGLSPPGGAASSPPPHRARPPAAAAAAATPWRSRVLRGPMSGCCSSRSRRLREGRPGGARQGWKPPPAGLWGCVGSWGSRRRKRRVRRTRGPRGMERTSLSCGRRAPAAAERAPPGTRSPAPPQVRPGAAAVSHAGRGGEAQGCARAACGRGGFARGGLPGRLPCPVLPTRLEKYPWGLKYGWCAVPDASLTCPRLVGSLLPAFIGKKCRRGAEVHCLRSAYGLADFEGKVLWMARNSNALSLCAGLHELIYIFMSVSTVTSPCSLSSVLWGFALFVSVTFFWNFSLCTFYRLCSVVGLATASWTLGKLCQVFFLSRLFQQLLACNPHLFVL